MLKQLKKLFGARPGGLGPDDLDEDDGFEETLLVNACSTLKEVQAPAFPHQLHGRRDASDPQFLPQLAGFMAYVQSLGDGEMTSTRYQVLRHLQRTRQQWSFTVGQNEYGAIEDWATAANALLFLPDGQVRDPQARVLVSNTGGGAEEGAEVPFPAPAHARKTATMAQLAARGLQAAPHLPPSVSEPELVLREPGEVARRALALFAVAVRAESLASGAPILLAQLEEKLPGLRDCLSPRETAFLADESPAMEAVTQYSWRYESLFLLEWALGLTPELPWPDTLCDAGTVGHTLLSGGWDNLLHHASLRPAGEILDMLDLHYRLHWLVRQARVDGQEAPGGLDPGVILERHHALNWLARFEDRAWDEVDTPT